MSEPERAIEHFVLIKAVPKEVPELLRTLPPLKSVRYRMECDGTGGEGAAHAELLILVVETIIARQHIDRFTVDEAAFILARATGDTWDNWQQRIVAAANDGTLSSYRSRSVAPRLGQMRLIESSVIEVYGDDLNQWVPSVAKRATYRFPPKGPAASVGVAPPAMLELTEVLSRDVETRVGLFEQGIQGTLRFLVMVPGIGACRAPLLALEQFKAGADAVTVDDMVEHCHGAHSGPYTIKANCLHILKDDWNKYEAEFEAIVEKFVAMERAAHGDEQRWIAGRRLWRLSEAVAHVTSMPGFGLSRHDLEERLSSHDESELLMVASLGSGKRSKADHLCVFGDYTVFAEDFNAWLEAAGFREPYRLPVGGLTAAGTSRESADVAVPSQNYQCHFAWSPNKPKKYHGYTKPLYEVLKAAFDAGQPKPTTREVLDAFKENKPREIERVLDDGIDYFTETGIKSADLKAISAAIRRMTTGAPR